MSRCDSADPDGDTPRGRREFTRYCLVTGLLSAAVGAAVSLLGGDLAVRLVLWVSVLLLMSAAAGWWWASAPATAHRWTVGLLVRPAAKDVSTRTPSRRS